MSAEARTRDTSHTSRNELLFYRKPQYPLIIFWMCTSIDGAGHLTEVWADSGGEASGEGIVREEGVAYVGEGWSCLIFILKVR